MLVVSKIPLDRRFVNNLNLVLGDKHMINIARKAVIALGVVLFLFTAASLFNPADASVLRTCCTERADGGASGDCDGCRNPGVETKNHGDLCDPMKVIEKTCEVCPPEFPKSNVCGGGGGGGGSCPIVSMSPASLNIREGSTMQTTASLQVAASRLGFIISNTRFASVSPKDYKSPAPGQYRANVLAGFPGTTTLVATAYGTGSGYEAPICSRTVALTIVPNPDNPLRCVEGAGCTVVGGGSPAVGKAMSCTMPLVPADILADPKIVKANTIYALNCDRVNANGTTSLGVVRQVKRNTTTAPTKFDNFTLVKGTYRCSFRYCLGYTNLTSRCSNWGKAL